MSMSIQQELEQLKAENAKLKQQSNQALKLKVAPKGGIMLLGLRGFPVTFYAGEWVKILAMGEAITQFIAANGSEIAKAEANPTESKNTFKGVRAVG